MFIPLDRKPDWNNPPLITFILIMVNVLFYFIWQDNDDLHTQEYYENYNYELVQIELPAYAKYRNIDNLSPQEIQNWGDQALQLAQEMLTDRAFQDKLDNNEIITPSNNSWPRWRELRAHVVASRDRIVWLNYGITPADPSLLTYFTSMFLHGSASHLWGNMIFLFLLGFVVEIILGRAIFFVAYMLSGLLSGYAYVLLFADSSVAGVGASGAISGILGMYIVLFGLRKIRFFYFLFVYFDYVKAPAIIILPFYILWQLYIQFGTETNINVTAHLGGLLGGIIIALIAKRFQTSLNTEYINQDVNKDKLQQQLSEGQQLLASMQVDKAKILFKNLYSQYPDNVQVLQNLFTLSKYTPTSPEYHQYAQKLLTLHGVDRATITIVHNTYLDYAKSDKPNWSPQLLIQLATRFARAGFVDDAEKISQYMLKAKKDLPGNAQVLVALIKANKNSNPEKAAQHRQTLLQMYPQSDEAKLIQQIG